MSSWQRPRSRSPSPQYRSRRYSPSREVSPPPPQSSTYSSLPPPPAQVYDPQGQYRRDETMTRPMRSEHYSPPPATRAPSPTRPAPAVYSGASVDRYAPPPGRRSRSPSPRYRGRRSPSPQRYRDPRPYSPPPERYRSPPPPVPSGRRNRLGAADFYDDPPRERDLYDGQPRPGAGLGRSMIADREEERVREIPPPRLPKVVDQWERGAEPQSHQGGYGYGDDHYQEGWHEDENPRGRGKGGPSAAYKDVIFLGLDDELTESDFSGYLTAEHQANITSVKIVRDRVTGKSKNFGFAQFATVRDAEDFVLPNYPSIQMPALFEHSEARKVKIDFSKPVGPPAGPGGAGTGAQAQSADYHQTNDIAPAKRHDGTRDIGPPGGGKRVLLLRMLDWNTRGEEIIRRLSQEIARMIGKQGKEQDVKKSIVRVAMIHDKAGRGASWGFAFVELVTNELAAALLSFLLSPQSQPNGFLIADRPIGISFANPAAFAPVTAGPLGGQFILRATRNGGIGAETIDSPQGTWCAYTQEGAGAVEVLPESGLAIGEDGSISPIPSTLRALLGSLAGKVPGSEPDRSAIVPPTAGLVSIANIMQPIKLGTGAIAMPKQARKADEAGLVANDGRRNVLGDDDEEQDLVGKDTVLLSRTKGAHIVPPTSGSRKIAKNISKWNNKQNELATPEPALISSGGWGGAPKGQGSKGISSANATLTLGGNKSQTSRTASSSVGQAGPSGSSRPIATSISTSTTTAASSVPVPVSVPIPTSKSASSSSSPTPAEDDFDYSGPQPDGKVACLLCQRKLPSIAVLRKHVATSDLHKTNLANPETVAAGKNRKLQQAATSSAGTGTSISTDPAAAGAAGGGTEDDTPKYRDRAAERRQVFHQPEKPHYMDRIALAVTTGPPKKKFAEGPKAPSPPPEPGLAPAEDGNNVGNALLTKMGWAAGTGLGAGSEGRLDPVEVKKLQERAGLGAGKR